MSERQRWSRAVKAFHKGLTEPTNKRHGKNLIHLFLLSLIVVQLILTGGSMDAWLFVLVGVNEVRA